MTNSSEQKNSAGTEVEARLSDDGSFELVVSDTGRMEALKEEGSGEPSAPIERAARAPSMRRYMRPGLIVLACVIMVGIVIWLVSGGDEEREEPRVGAFGQSDGFKPYSGGAAAAKSGRARERNSAEPSSASDQGAGGARRAAGARVGGSAADDDPARELQEDLEQIRQQQGWEIDEAGVDELPEALPSAENDERLEPADEDEPLQNHPEEEADLAAEDERAPDERDEGVDEYDGEEREDEQYEEGEDEEPYDEDEALEEQADDYDYPDDYDEQQQFIGEDEQMRQRVRSPRLERQPGRGLERIEIRRLGRGAEDPDRDDWPEELEGDERDEEDYYDDQEELEGY